MPDLSTAQARALQSLLEHPDGLRLPAGFHPSSGSDRTWRRLVRRGYVICLEEGTSETWSITDRGREVYTACVDALAEDFAEALRADPGDYVEIRPRVFAERLDWEDLPRWENEGGAVFDVNGIDDVGVRMAAARFERRRELDS